jgi:hypothetical protein
MSSRSYTEDSMNLFLEKVDLYYNSYKSALYKYEQSDEAYRDRTANNLRDHLFQLSSGDRFYVKVVSECYYKYFVKNEFHADIIRESIEHIDSREISTRKILDRMLEMKQNNELTPEVPVEIFMMMLYACQILKLQISNTIQYQNYYQE